MARRAALGALGAGARWGRGAAPCACAFRRSGLAWTEGEGASVSWRPLPRRRPAGAADRGHPGSPLGPGLSGAALPVCVRSKSPAGTAVRKIRKVPLELAQVVRKLGWWKRRVKARVLDVPGASMCPLCLWCSCNRRRPPVPRSAPPPHTVLGAGSREPALTGQDLGRRKTGRLMEHIKVYSF